MITNVANKMTQVDDEIGERHVEIHAAPNTSQERLKNCNARVQMHMSV